MEFIEIEKIFDDFLLYNIEILHGKKLLKSGKLKLVSVKNHNIKIYIETNQNSIKILELYYPFNYTKENNIICFDYNTNLIIKNNKLINLLISSFDKDKKSKLLDSQIIIKKV